MFFFLALLINHQLPPFLQYLCRLLTSQYLSNGSFCDRKCGVNLGRINIVFWSYLHMCRTATFFGCLFFFFFFFLFFVFSHFCYLLSSDIGCLISRTISDCS